MKNTISVKDFCDKHNACTEGREWAISTGCETMADLWTRGDFKPDWRIWTATREGVLDDKTLRLFACWSVRQVWPLLTDERSRNAVVVAERYADGNATSEELAAASDAASAAALAAARDAARAAARDAAWAAARAAAWAAASDAAWAAAWDAAWDAESDAASDAASAAARDAQAQWLIENASPVWGVS